MRKYVHKTRPPIDGCHYVTPVKADVAIAMRLKYIGTLDSGADPVKNITFALCLAFNENPSSRPPSSQELLHIFLVTTRT
jgi:hypothetical protein